MDADVQAGGPGIFRSIGLAKIVQLLRYMAGDPRLTDRATFIASNQSVTDAVVSNIAEAQDESQQWSLAVLQFKATSGDGYYDPTGGQPTATGTRGIELPAGGGTLTIRGVWNIRRLNIIAATGQTMTYTVTLYKTSVWATGLLAEKG